MPQLLCRYDLDPPVIVAAYHDDQDVDPAAHPECVLVPFAGDPSVLGRVGPEPELMGDPPTECYPGHAELDREGIPRFILDPDGEPARDADGDKIPHPFRLRAGKPYPDNRRRAIDMRPWAAPPQSDPVTQKAYLAHFRWAKETGGITVDGFPASTARGDIRLQQQTDAARASRDPKFSKRVKGADGAFHTLDAAALIKVADAVSDHVQACFDAEDKLLPDIADGKLPDFKPIDAAFAEVG